ncbi:MAG: hypothetical protein SF069_02590 [Phycisphaerae bacterium]|nr:hypothetical protein [Phycisphaerae bacterium]
MMRVVVGEAADVSDGGKGALPHDRSRSVRGIQFADYVELRSDVVDRLAVIGEVAKEIVLGGRTPWTKVRAKERERKSRWIIVTDLNRRGANHPIGQLELQKKTGAEREAELQVVSKFAFLNQRGETRSGWLRAEC